MYPDYEKYFIKFKKGGQSSLFDNPEFQKHITENVMNSLNAIFDNLDKEDKLKEILNTIATNHSKRNVKKQQYETLGKVILEVVKRGLKESYTTELETSWTKIITCAMEHMGNIAGEK
ncbi:hypothetical protein O3M35_006549 [Rhynocoris fuscipes]|uniref:Globin domain-containing protein n=1 Tax=Rhynocoris fuscipes TaxID=488301 RepID=A0AAW1DFJ6_9HEMI